jgi:MFS family permease
VIRGLDLVAGGPFARATFTNFVFMSSLSCFILLPLYVQSLGGTEAQIGLVQGVYSAAGILCQPLIGHWLDRIGRRFFMTLGVSLLIVSSAAFLVTHSLVLLAALRAVQGLGFSAFFVANYMHVIDLVPVERRGWALGIYGVSGFLGTALAPVAGEIIVRRLGFPALFVLSVQLGLVAAWLVIRMRGILPPRMGEAPGLESLRAGLAEVLRLHMALAFFFGLGTGAMFTFLPTFGEALGVHSVSLFYTAYAIAAVGVRVAGGNLIDTRGRRAMIVPSMFVLTASTGLLTVLALLVRPQTTMPVVPFLFLTGLLAGAAHGFLYPALAALLMDVTPEARRGGVVGIFSAVFLVGNALGSMVFGYIAHGLGYFVMWTTLTVLLAAGFGLSFRLRVGHAVRMPHAV